ncbi:MAG: GldG family protein [Anaerolineales bacterium]|nr:GldG family protein [Anaerolineales bacterium]
MKPEWRRFAPAGLYLSLLAALFSAGYYMIMREFDLYLQIGLGLIVIGLALFALLDPDRVRRMLTGRQARYGSNALVLSLAFTGIIVVVNYLVSQNPKRWDLTEDKEFTLSPETLDTLAKLEEPVLAQAFFTARVTTGDAESLLDQYKFYSDGKFDYEFIDPDADPVAAEQAKITRDGTVVLNMAGRQEPVTYVSEQEMTGAMVRLMNPEARVIYFLTGHGEYSPEDSGEQSYALVKRTLESKNYAVKLLNLLADQQIPSDASVIVIAGPNKPLSSEEVDQLSLFLSDGGALVVMEEPTLLTEFGDAPDPLADYLLQSWGVVLGKDLVIDQSSNQPTVAVGSEWGSHAITQKLAGYVSILPTARSVSIVAAPIGVTQATIVSTSARSWAETDTAALVSGGIEVSPNPDVDIIGPVPLAVVGEKFDTDSRVVVLGDADFASDAGFVAYANGDLFINSVDWAAGQEELISLTPKDTTERFLAPPHSTTMNLILLGTVIVLPGLALVGGIVVFFQRRRRG